MTLHFGSRLQRIFPGLAALLLLAPVAGAFNLTLQWDPSPDPGIAGYRIYIGTESRSYDTVTNVGFTIQKSITTLQPKRLYYIAVTAYASNGLESAFSNEAAVYTAALDGTNTLSVPVRISFFNPASPLGVLFTGQAGRQYLVQATEDLHCWQSVGVVSPSTNGMALCFDTGSPTHSQRFYRVLCW